MSDSVKPSQWKGPSRVHKSCHWCTKKQEEKPFQACARCKQVIYCSKACQVASWPHHKAGCKLNSETQAATAQNPAMGQAIATFKKWHAHHVPALRQAAICALDLGNNPSAVDEKILYVEVKLKIEHQDLPVSQKYEPVNGLVFTFAEAAVMLGPGAASILESAKSASLYMKQKGGLGVATIFMQAHDAVDIVKVVLPSHAAAKVVQATANWGEDWPERLRLAM